MTAQQWDLFGEAEAAAKERDDEAEWRKTLLGPVVPAPWDMADGTKKDSPVQMYRCPNCGLLQFSEYLLWIDHGVDYDDQEGFCGWMDGSGYRLLDDGTLSDPIDPWAPKDDE